MPHPESKATTLGMGETLGEPSTRRAAMSHNPGKRTRNPYLNYLREFRRKNYHLTAVEIVRQGAMHWNKLTDEQKLPFIRTAFYTPMRPRRCAMCRMKMGRSRRYTSVIRKSRDTPRVKQERTYNQPIEIKTERKMK